MDKDSRSVGASGTDSRSAPASVICSLCGAESVLSERGSCSNCGALIGTTHHQGKAIGGALTSGGKRRHYRGVVVFSGTLSMRRDRVAAAASRAGWEVAANVSGRTTLVVVGVQDMSKLAGSEESTKQRKAESLIAAGYKIRIVDESEFWRLVAQATE